jgi:hypothetical protein
MLGNGFGSSARVPRKSNEVIACYGRLFFFPSEVLLLARAGQQSRPRR